MAPHCFRPIKYRPLPLGLALPRFRWHRSAVLLVHPDTIHSSAGFSLIEVVIIIIVMSIIAVPLTLQFSQSANSWQLNEQVQTASQLAQGCGEELLSTRRLSGHTAALSTSCSVLPASFSSYSRALSFSSFSATACPDTSCTLAEVVVTIGGNERARLPIMLANY